MLQIGRHQLPNNVVVAPMAGVTDLPFRELCVELGAGLAVGEMLTADLSLLSSRKSSLRRQQSKREGIRSIQIVGNDPQMLATAAKFNADEGADIIDINMGCPAKKVCKKAAGSALLADEQLVGEILNAVVNAVDVPVTLKIRTGTDRDNRNGAAIARIAEAEGVQMLAVHGRTRADKFNGDAEYDTIAAIVQSVAIPVLANGDITSVAKAQSVLKHTGAAGVMIGRAAQGQPWLPGQIAAALSPEDTTIRHFNGCEQRDIIHRHLIALHEFYGPVMGVRIARKHIGWYLDTQDNGAEWKSIFNKLQSEQEQITLLEQFASQPSAQRDHLAA